MSNFKVGPPTYKLVKIRNLPILYLYLILEYALICNITGSYPDYTPTELTFWGPRSLVYVGHFPVATNHRHLTNLTAARELLQCGSLRLLPTGFRGWSVHWLIGWLNDG